MRLHVEAPEKCSCPAACCELMETAQSLGDDAHAVAMGPTWESTDFTVVCGPRCRFVVSVAHRQVLEQGRGPT